MILKREKDICLRKCDMCGQEQWVSYWNVYKLERHLCRGCNNAEQGVKKRGRVSHNKGKKKSNPKIGSTLIDASGYVNVYMGSLSTRAGKYMLQHRMVVEADLGRKLDSKEVVHHVDGDKTHNNLANLFVCTSMSHHRLVHKTLESAAFELVKSGFIIFDTNTGKYGVAPQYSNVLSAGGEFGETPNEKDEGNTEPSLSNEEGVTTIREE